MTTLNRSINLYINGNLPGGRNAILDGQTSNPTNLRPALMQGDKCPIRLYFRSPGDPGEDSTAVDLGQDYSLVLCGKIEASLKNSAELFRVSDWAHVGDYYEGTLDLTTSALATAMTEENSDALDVAIDIEYRDIANSVRLTYRADVTVFRQVYDSIGIPPSTLSASYLQSPDGSNWRLTVDDNGQLAIDKVGDEQADPDFVILSYANLISPSGYWWQISIDDNGQISKRRIQ